MHLYNNSYLTLEKRYENGSNLVRISLEYWDFFKVVFRRIVGRKELGNNSEMLMAKYLDMCI